MPGLASGLPDYESACGRVGALMQATAHKFSTVAKLEDVSLEDIVGKMRRVDGTCSLVVGATV